MRSRVWKTLASWPDPARRTRRRAGELAEIARAASRRAARRPARQLAQCGSRDVSGGRWLRLAPPRESVSFRPRGLLRDAECEHTTATCQHRFNDDRPRPEPFATGFPPRQAFPMRLELQVPVTLEHLR